MARMLVAREAASLTGQQGSEVSEVRHQLASRISQRKRTEGVVASTSEFYDELGR